MAYTAHNLGLAQAGHCLVGKHLRNSKLRVSWQVCVSPACAKPWHVKCYSRTSAYSKNFKMRVLTLKKQTKQDKNTAMKKYLLLTMSAVFLTKE